MGSSPRCVVVTIQTERDTDDTEFIEAHPEHLAEDNAMKYLSDDGGETYNKCHCR